MDNTKDDVYYLKRMLEIIEYIEEYHSFIIKSHSGMKPNDPNSDAILYKFIQLREEANHLSNEVILSNDVFKKHIKSLIDFRNILAHDYDGVSYTYFDDVFSKDLPSLKEEIMKLLK